ncbi:MAG: ATPase domain-containing protein [Haloarculaceae archaeon]
MTATYHGSTYTFCCEHCRDAMEDQERVFTQWHGGEDLQPGVAAFDASLPQGLPRNSFVLLSGQSGTRDEAVLAELAWRRLQAGEPVIAVTFLDSPTSVVQTFIDLGWNVLPYLESGQLEVFDCFTYRLDDRERLLDRANDWNRHLAAVTESSLTVVEDPSNVSAILSRLDRCLDAHEMHDRGAVVIDSLTELGTLVQPVKAYDFVKNVRAEVCKARFVPVFAHASVTVEEAEFPHDLGYMVDGVVDMRFDAETVPGTLLKQLRVRKTNGVLTIPEWHTYEYTAGTGMVVFDPEAEIEKAREQREEAGTAGEEDSDADDPVADDDPVAEGDPTTPPDDDEN